MKSLRDLTLLIVLMLHAASLSAQGLLFNGMENSIENRTSYQVFVSKTPEFRETLRIEFSVAMYHPSDFGYILRIKNKEAERIFNLLYSGEHWNSSHPLRLNEEGKSSIIKTDIPHNYFETGKWIRICLEFKMQEGKIYLQVDDYKYETEIVTLPETWSPVIDFGKSDYMIDVPSMAIKDLVVEDDHRRYFFPLNEYDGVKVKEKERKIYGQVSNPQWLVRKSYNWEEVAKFSSTSRAGVNYDKHSKSVMYYNSDSIHVYNLINKTARSIKYGAPCPVELYLGSSFVDPHDYHLNVYEPYHENQQDNSPTVASYDFNQNIWAVRSYETLPIRFHHHSSYLDEQRGKFVIFGGFGNMAYNGDFYSYDLEACTWNKDTLPSGDKIFPRYFTSVGYDEKDDAVYVFGGMGNESGEQIVGRHYFYDLHKIDLKSGRNTRIWGEEKVLNWEEENMVPVRSLVVDGDSFYTMCYPEFYTNSFLQLYHFDIKNATYTKLCDKVPIRSDKMSTNANLYFDKDLRLLILTVMESSDDIKSQVRIYTLSFPPLTDEEYLAMSEKSQTWITLIIGLGIIIIGALIFAIRRRRCQHKSSNPKYVNNARKRHFVEQRPNSICLFGGFSAIGTNGMEVAFPYQQKKLFCLIIKYSLDSGISSTRLSKVMWPDKSEDKVKNSRGVAINHLRKLLENFEGISLIFEDSHFRIECKEDFFCDWIEFKRESKSKNPDIEKILSIVARGKFLPFIEDPVFDTFKERTETKLIDMLTSELVKNFSQRQYQAAIEVAEVISYSDPLNEQALTWHINSLVKMRRTEDALVRYAAFVKEYKAMYDSDYGNDFKSLLK